MIDYYQKIILFLFIIYMSTKRARKHNARPLPEGLTQEMLPKYVVYYHECYNKERQLFR